MLKIENVQVLGWEHAVRGMRNPLNSWDKSDSDFSSDTARELSPESEYHLGPADYSLMTRLRNAGTDHRKYMRMITVYMDILAPLYWWKEFDTYKVGTVANSCSTMHKIAAKAFDISDFSHEHLADELEYERLFKTYLIQLIYGLNEARDKYLETGDKFYWWQMIQLLPSSYNQRRTIMLNYEVLANIYKARRKHKLDEWRAFCDWIRTLPYSELITGGVQ